MTMTNWQKASYCGEGSGCIELASAGGAISLRESDEPDVVLAAGSDSIRPFIGAIKAGDWKGAGK